MSTAVPLKPVRVFLGIPFASLGETFPGIDWNHLASYMVGRVVVHGERRAREMEEVAETLRSIGIEPIMAEAASPRMDWSVRQGLNGKFGAGRSGELRRVCEESAVNRG